MSTPPDRLMLRPIDRVDVGESIEPLELSPPGPYEVGRSVKADWVVRDQRVSREHAVVTLRDGRWYLHDRNSRHGTTVNGARISAEDAYPIEHGDLIGLGAWTCRCLKIGAHAPMTTPFSQLPPSSASVAAVDRSRLGGVAQRGLNALLELSRAMERSTTEQEVAEAVVAAVRASTGCNRVVVVRAASETEIEVLASSTAEVPEVSRSLIDAASTDGLAELRIAPTGVHHAHSILELNIRSAICAAIKVGEVPAAFLVLDTRDTERELPSDATAFCESVAQIAGLALERIHSARLAERHAQLELDMDAARRAQELLMPTHSGSAGRVRYVFESLAGRVVAGDFFDVVALAGSSVGFMLGDVAGKGMGAAVLMAAAQSQLRAHLIAGVPLSGAVARVNADLFRRTEPSKFITLIAGVIDCEQETLEIADAGHGLHALVPAEGDPARVDTPSGYPLGIVEEGEHQTITVAFPTGSLFVAFSDGVVEQPDSQGRQFGLDAAMQTLRGSTEPESVVESLVAGVRAHADGPLADDLTVAALQLASRL